MLPLRSEPRFIWSLRLKRFLPTCKSCRRHPGLTVPRGAAGDSDAAAACTPLGSRLDCRCAQSGDGFKGRRLPSHPHPPRPPGGFFLGRSRGRLAFLSIRAGMEPTRPWPHSPGPHPPVPKWLRFIRRLKPAHLQTLAPRASREGLWRTPGLRPSSAPASSWSHTSGVSLASSCSADATHLHLARGPLGDGGGDAHCFPGLVPLEGRKPATHPGLLRSSKLGAETPRSSDLPAKRFNQQPEANTPLVCPPSAFWSQPTGLEWRAGPRSPVPEPRAMTAPAFGAGLARSNLCEFSESCPALPCPAALCSTGGRRRRGPSCGATGRMPGCSLPIASPVAPSPPRASPGAWPAHPPT